MKASNTSPMVRELRGLLAADRVLHAPAELTVYECDGYTVEKARPEAVVFPQSAAEVAAVVKLANRYQVPLVARGAGTSLAGGCLPVGGGIVVMLTRMNRLLEVNLRDRYAVLEAGALTVQLARTLAGSGHHFAPDPSSQTACTIGGNVATNAGGPHTLKYGVTVNHVLGLEAVLGDGTVVELGPTPNPGSLDLTGVLVGSEGTMAIVTKVWVKLTPNPLDLRTIRVIFDSIDDATQAISDIIGAGIVPAAMELMDQGIIASVEQAFHFGFPLDAGAIVVIELDGPPASLDAELEQVLAICRNHRAREVLHASSADERAMLWKCRKLAVGSLGRLSPSYFIQDGVVPRTRLPEMLRAVAAASAAHRVRIVNVAHAGDGNVHPMILFDERDRDEVSRAMAAGHELLQACIALGGSITAEHGIGVEKLALMDKLFSPADLAAMALVREAFNPSGRLGFGKVLPPLVPPFESPAPSPHAVSR